MTAALKQNWGGGHVWATLKNVALGSPDNPSAVDKQNYKNFIFYTLTVLPCAECSGHALAYLDKNPLNMSSRNTFVKWVVDFHVHVSKKLDKSYARDIAIPDTYIVFEHPRSILYTILFFILGKIAFACIIRAYYSKK